MQDRHPAASISAMIIRPSNVKSGKERVFCAIAYWPKATVQAAIGTLPLVAGVASGAFILTAAVLAILISAPLGAVGIELTYKRLLKRSSSTDAA